MVRKFITDKSSIMNWGTKIVIVFFVFVSGMLFMVFKSAQQNTDLVVPDYYEQELKYQDVIDATARTQALSGVVICKVNNDSIDIVFPKDMHGKEMNGEVWLYCIADKKKDLKKTFSINETNFAMPFNILNKGLHEVKINWEANGKSYYHEQKIFIQ